MPNGWNEKTGRYFLVFLLLGSAVALLSVIWVFAIPVILAVALTALLHPLYRRLVKYTGNRRNLSSFIACAILLLILVVPVGFITQLLIKQAVYLSESAGAQITAMVGDDQQQQNFLARIRRSRLFSRTFLAAVNWDAIVRDAAGTIAKFSGRIINLTSQATLEALLGLFVLFYCMFYFFRDGKMMARQFGRLLPLSAGHRREFMERFVSISRATIKGSVIIGLIQATLGGLTLAVFGVRAWLLWAIVMALFAIIPALGAWTVLIPAGVIFMLQGHVWQGLFILVISTAVVSVIDDIIRPVLVGKDAHMHNLMVFLSTLGGIGLFGIMGFIIGPIIAAFFLTALDIFAREFGAADEASARAL